MTISKMVVETFSQLRVRLDRLALEALRSGMDWVEGPIEDVDPNRWMRDPNPFEPHTIDITVRCGAVERNTFTPIYPFRIIKHDDWIAAGRPGEDAT